MSKKLSRELKSLLLIILATDSITDEQSTQLAQHLNINTVIIKIVDE